MTVKLSINFGKIAIYYPNMLFTFMLLFIMRMRNIADSLFLIVFLHILFTLSRGYIGNRRFGSMAGKQVLEKALNVIN